MLLMAQHVVMTSVEQGSARNFGLLTSRLETVIEQTKRALLKVVGTLRWNGLGGSSSTAADNSVGTKA